MQTMKKARGSSRKSKGRASSTTSKRRAAPKSKVQLASRSDLKKWRDIGMRNVAAAVRPAMIEAGQTAAKHMGGGQENEEGTTKVGNQTNWGPLQGPSASFGMAPNDSAAILTGRSWNAIRGLQRYNEHLVAMAQNNINLALDFFWRSATAKSPSQFITVVTEHVRRQYEISSQQAKELVALAQGFAQLSR